MNPILIQLFDQPLTIGRWCNHVEVGRLGWAIFFNHINNNYNNLKPPPAHKTQNDQFWIRILEKDNISHFSYFVRSSYMRVLQRN